MIKVFSRFTALIVWVLAVMVFNPTQALAAVGDTFTSDQLKYTVLTEEDTSGTAAVSGYVSAPTTITIPGSVSHDGKTYSVTSLGDDAFSWCDSLTTLTIPASVTAIAQSAFSACFSLEQVYYEGNVPETQPGLYDAAPDTLISYYKAANKTSWESVIVDGKWQGRSIELDSKEKLEYQFYNDGTACVTGIGSFSDNILIIPSTVREKQKTYKVISIGNKAFFGCTNLTSITIPDSVTSVGNSAFSKCVNLTSIIIPDSVTSIGSGAFNGCNQLPPILFSVGKKILARYSSFNTETFYTVPDTVTFIADYAFIACRSLTSITIPDSVTSIGNYAFSQCYDLTSVTIGNGLISIGDRAFNSCNSLTSITIPNSVTSIGSSAFSSCSSLTNITIPDSVTSIENGAFSGCSSLTDITIPTSVTSIGKHSFHNCSSLTSITIPNSVISIGSSAFSFCTKLTSIYFKGNAPKLGESDVFENTPVLTIYYLDGTTGWTNPWGGKPTVQCAGWMVQDGVVYIYQSNGTASVIDYMGRLEKAIISKVISIDSINYSVISIGMYSFYDCSSLTSIIIPDSVTSIGSGAFRYCKNITSITIPDSINYIGSYAFSFCSNLTSIMIPDSVTLIGNGAFEGCEKLPSILFSTGKKILVRYSSSNKETSYVIPDTVTYIASSAFSYCSNLTSIMIPNKVTSIGSDAFYNCSSLASITLSDNVTSIGNWTFSKCSSLTSITIPNSVISIGNHAFSNCSNLTRVYFKGDAPTISSSVFTGTEATIYYIAGTEGWTNPWGGRPTVAISPVTYNYHLDGTATVTGVSEEVLFFDEIKIPSTVKKDGVIYTVTTIAEKAFYGNEILTRVLVPDSVITIGTGAFSNCANLVSVTVGKGITFIGNGAFFGCDSLTEIYFEGNAPELGRQVFFNTPATIYYQAGTEGWTDPWGDRPTVMIHEEVPVLTCALEGDMIRLQWTADADAVLQVSDDAVDDWTDVTEGIQTESGSCVYKVPATAKQAFYRLKIQ